VPAAFGGASPGIAFLLRASTGNDANSTAASDRSSDRRATCSQVQPTSARSAGAAETADIDAAASGHSKDADADANSVVADTHANANADADATSNRDAGSDESSADGCAQGSRSRLGRT
jgi:hypothetical protein